MAQLGGTRKPLLDALVGFRRAYARLATQTAEQATLILNRSAIEGMIPPQNQVAVREQIGGLVEGLFFVPGTKQVFDDEQRGLTPYARLLNQYMVNAMSGVLNAHGRHMRTHLPSDVQAKMVAGFRWRENAGPVDPKSTAERDLPAKFSDLRIFTPDALEAYQTPHAWVDPNGRQLGDRIWRTGRKLREQTDDLLNQGMRQEVPVAVLAARLERFIRPDRAALREKAVYGTDGSYQPMLLANTEITLAHARTSLVAARMNPFMNVIYFYLSERHPKPDICDDFAARSPYDIMGFVPMPVIDTHHGCLCGVVAGSTRSPSVVVVELIEALALAQLVGIPPYLTPLSPQLFLAQLIGAGLAALMPGAVAV